MGFSYASIELGEDPDGEGRITATLVRHDESVRGADSPPRAAILWVHGFSDYFFQRHLAERLAAEGIAFYALDLRKSGRSLRPGLTPHYSTDLSQYDEEMDAALGVVAAETGSSQTRAESAGTTPTSGAPIIVAGHSTGGLVVCAWLARRGDRGASPERVRGVLLDGPWLGFDAHAYLGTHSRIAAKALDGLIAALARIAPKWVLPAPANELYGSSLAADRGGEFEYERALKPLGGVGIRPGWLAAVRREQRRIERGPGFGLSIPVLLIRSSRSSRTDVDMDLILDVRTMARLAPKISSNVRDRPLDGARHDAFVSAPAVREQVMAEVLEWMADKGIVASVSPDSSPPGPQPSQPQ